MLRQLCLSVVALAALLPATTVAHARPGAAVDPWSIKVTPRLAVGYLTDPQTLRGAAQRGLHKARSAARSTAQAPGSIARTIAKDPVGYVAIDLPFAAAAGSAAVVWTACAAPLIAISGAHYRAQCFKREVQDWAADKQRQRSAQP